MRNWSERLWKAPCGSILDMSHWEETSGQVRNPLEGTYSSWLGKTWHIPEEELQNVAKENDSWATLIFLLSLQSDVNNQRQKYNLFFLISVIVFIYAMHDFIYI